MTAMRAKLKVGSVQVYRNQETGETIHEQVSFYAVAKNGYDASGLDEDNTFAKMSPSASLNITIANPALHGQFEPGQAFYVDFTEVPPKG